MRKGFVKWFDARKGYGFIVQEDNSQIFVYYTDIVKEGFKSLRRGESVNYDVAERDGREIAVNVTVVKKA